MRLALLALLALLVFAPAAQARLYHTDAQAERALERSRGGSAFCLNGYYSDYEQRTGRHWPDPNPGDDRFRSFTCALTDEQGETTQKYLRTRRHPSQGRRHWLIRPDR